MQIKDNVSLKNLNTFGIAVKAKQFVEINHEQDLIQLYEDNGFKGRFLILGGGSNMLFLNDFDGLVIRINIKGINNTIENDDVFVSAGAGEVWNDLVNYCVDNGFAGMENLSLIPGSVGASPVQNIGAYGVELMDIFYSCKAFDIATGTFSTFYNADCNFSYRESIFKQALKGKFIITEVVFKLSKKQNLKTSYGAIEQELNKQGIKNPDIKAISKVVSQIRVSKLPDPSTIGNAGSFFKNPVISKDYFNELIKNHPDVVHYPAGDEVKLAAGYLIEQCGWKGFVSGQTGTWKNQALVLVNFGAASGQEVFDFSEKIIESVRNKYKINLEREVNVIS